MFRIYLAISTLVAIALMNGCAGASVTKEVPMIASVSPSKAMAGSQNTKIIVVGVNVSYDTTILVNGMSRATTFLRNGRLSSVLSETDLRQIGTLHISIGRGANGGTPKTSITQSSDSIDFAVTPGALKILTASVPSATVKDPYSVTLDAQGGTAPYNWKITSGALPAGLSLITTGVISGSPKQAGQFSFSVQVASSSSTAQTVLTIKSSAAPKPVPPPTPPSPPPPPPKPPAAVELPNTAELPRSYVDTTMPSQTGLAINVPAGGDLQGELNAATCGDTIQLAQGATFTGNFVLPARSCDGWVLIRTSASNSSLPSAGARITPAYSHVLPKIITPNSGPAISAQFGAAKYRFLGVEITTSFSTLESEQYGLVNLGNSPSTGKAATAVSELPHHITIDRCYIHGTPTGNVKTGVVFNGASLAVIDSYISDIHVVGQDTQAVIGWNGPGPFKIVNNELEAAGENIMFGGVQPALLNNIPSDIEIRGNHFFKPLSWMVGNPSYTGTHWSVKNLLEFKNAQRVLVTENILENNWVDGQTGFALQITPRTEDGKAPWIYVQDITLTYNIFRHTASGVNISGLDGGDPQKIVRGRRILIQNNLLYDVDGETWRNGNGRLFQIISGSDAVTIDHNTGFQSSELIFADGVPNTNFVYEDNITPHNTYGLMGSGAAPGNSTLSRYFPGSFFQNNIIENLRSSGVAESNYPVGNLFPADWAAVKFVDFTKGDYTLAPSSPYKNAGIDGKDIGADISGLLARTTSAIPH